VRVAAVVPVKSLHLAKSRLAGRLSQAGRAQLALWLLERVCEAVGRSAVVERLAVVSPDAEVLRWASGRGLRAIAQRTGDLNAAVELGRAWAQTRDADALLVLLGDLPLLAPEDVRSLCELAADIRNDGDANARRGAMVLAPDRSGQGTNGLVLAPPGDVPFAFGVGSYAQHVALARGRHVATGLYISPRTAFDVDGPGDLAEIAALGLWRAAAADEAHLAAGEGRTDGRAG
jgi:2-phospho-L-lactate guanylyltransferase